MTSLPPVPRASPIPRECVLRFFLKYLYIYFLIWLGQALVATCRIFHCDMQDLVPWRAIKPRSPTLRTQSLNHWTTREIPRECILNRVTLLFKKSLTQDPNEEYNRPKQRAQNSSPPHLYLILSTTQGQTSEPQDPQGHLKNNLQMNPNLLIKPLWLESESVGRSVVFDSLRPNRVQPARLLCPQNSPGKNTRVGFHSLLHALT